MTVRADSVRDLALAAWKACDPVEKCKLVERLKPAVTDFEQTSALTNSALDNMSLEAPGRPAHPELVRPKHLPKRSLATIEGHAAFIHAICHIEFSAINLALDATIRFPQLPPEFACDWASVAVEEAEHFQLLHNHLETLGFSYGDFPAHGGLWDLAWETRDDPLRRMALIPRVMEARGLDVTPGMIDRLRDIDDEAGAQILVRILEDEIGHVAIGSKWFSWLCQQANVNVEQHFLKIVSELSGQPRGSLNHEARIAAGFTVNELDALNRS